MAPTICLAYLISVPFIVRLVRLLVQGHDRDVPADRANFFMRIVIALGIADMAAALALGDGWPVPVVVPYVDTAT